MSVEGQPKGTSDGINRQKPWMSAIEVKPDGSHRELIKTAGQLSHDNINHAAWWLGNPGPAREANLHKLTQRRR